jgi:hypothetical protein
MYCDELRVLTFSMLKLKVNLVSFTILVHMVQLHARKKGIQLVS